MILDQTVGLEHVGTDLAAPGDLVLLAFQGAHFRFPFPQLDLQQLGLEHLHGHGLVLELGAFVLTGDHDAGGQMGDADGGVGLVDLLPALAG